MERVVSFENEVEPFAEGIEFVTEKYVTGERERINDPAQVSCRPLLSCTHARLSR